MKKTPNYSAKWQSSLESFGQRLKEQRQELGLDLFDVSQALKIREAYLLCLEEGDFEALPGRAYGLGFLRSYADYLGFDGALLAKQIKDLLDQENESPSIVSPKPVSDVPWPGAGILAASLVIAGLTFGGWHLFTTADRGNFASLENLPEQMSSYVWSFADKISPEDEGTAATISSTERAISVSQDKIEPAAFSTSSSSDSSHGAMSLPPMLNAKELNTRPNHETLALLRGLSRNYELPIKLLAEENTLVEGAQSEAPVQARTFGNPTGHRIAIKAVAESWVQIESAAKDYRWTRVMAKGDTLFLPNRTDLLLWTGNAGGIQVMIDNQSHGLLGEQGEVVRDVIISHETFLAGRP